MVKAIRFHEFGGPEVLKFEDISLGDLAPGEVRIRHTAIGFNFLDALVRAGKYPVLPELQLFQELRERASSRLSAET